MEVGPSSRTSLLGALSAAENILPPLIDTNNERYQPIACVYRTRRNCGCGHAGDPIRSMSQLPSLSRSRPSQKMVLLFRVSIGRDVRFCAGNKVVYEHNPPSS